MITNHQNACLDDLVVLQIYDQKPVFEKLVRDKARDGEERDGNGWKCWGEGCIVRRGQGRTIPRRETMLEIVSHKGLPRRLGRCHRAQPQDDEYIR